MNKLLKQSHQCKTSYKYMIWHIDENLFLRTAASLQQKVQEYTLVCEPIEDSYQTVCICVVWSVLGRCSMDSQGSNISSKTLIRLCWHADWFEFLLYADANLHKFTPKIFLYWTLKRQEKNASENVVCWSRLLQIID